MSHYSSDEVKLLIAELKKRPCLWDVSCKAYNNKIKKNIEYVELANILKKTVEEIKSKIHKLRTQHSGERNKIKSKKQGNTIYVSKWEHFEGLNFLFTEKNTDENNDDAEIDPLDTVSKIKYEVNPSPPSTPKKKRRKLNDEPPKQPSNEPNMNLLLANDFSVIEDGVDEHQVFVDYIASEFRVLKNDNLRFLLRRKIQRAILEVSELVDNNTTNLQCEDCSSSL